ncbi:unnamed protein product, partial [Brachionus calyciflorus]
WSKIETAKQLFEAVGYGNEEELCLNVDENEDVDTPEDVLIQRDYELEEEDLLTQQIQEKISNVLQNQARQAETMKTRSKRYLPDVSIGDFSALPISDVDKGLTESPNFFCRVIDIDYSKSLYESGTLLF